MQQGTKPVRIIIASIATQRNTIDISPPAGSLPQVHFQNGNDLYDSLMKFIVNVNGQAAYGWIAPSFSGTQLKSGRLAVCADHIVGQWVAYPITHTISSVITSDDHGDTWQWQPAGSPDGAEMNGSWALPPSFSLCNECQQHHYCLSVPLPSVADLTGLVLCRAQSARSPRCPTARL